MKRLESGSKNPTIFYILHKPISYSLGAERFLWLSEIGLCLRSQFVEVIIFVVRIFLRLFPSLVRLYP